MAEYIEREEFLKRIKPYNTSDKMDKALYNFALNRMIETPTAAVVERSKVDKAREDIKNLTPWDEGTVEMYEVLEILDRLIESEG